MIRVFKRKTEKKLIRRVDNRRVTPSRFSVRCKRLTIRFAEVLLVNSQDIVAQRDNLSAILLLLLLFGEVVNLRTISLSSPNLKLSCTT